MVQSMLKEFWCEENGQDLVEYSLLMAFIAVAAVAMLTSARTSIQGIWNSVNTKLQTAQSDASK